MKVGHVITRLIIGGAQENTVPHVRRVAKTRLGPGFDHRTADGTERFDGRRGVGGRQTGGGV